MTVQIEVFFAPAGSAVTLRECKTCGDHAEHILCLAGGMVWRTMPCIVEGCDGVRSVEDGLQGNCGIHSISYALVRPGLTYYERANDKQKAFLVSGGLLLVNIPHAVMEDMVQIPVRAAIAVWFVSGVVYLPTRKHIDIALEDYVKSSKHRMVRAIVESGKAKRAEILQAAKANYV